MHRLAVLGGLVAMIGAATGLALLLRPAPADVAPARDMHTILHIGCKHHAHGPRWHEEHGRILGARLRRDADHE